MNDPSRRAPSRPFDAIRVRLADARDISLDPRSNLQLDPSRRNRTGIPEVVLARGKSPAVVRDALIGLAGVNGRSIASRCQPSHLTALREGFPPRYRVEVHDDAEAAVVVQEGHANAMIAETGGRI